MSTSYYQVRRGEKVLGWVSHQNTAMCWHTDTFPSREAAGTYTDFHRCTCKAYDSPSTVVERATRVDLWEWWGGEFHREESGFWCETCQAFLCPPFDGYSHHRYGCDCGKCS